MGKEIEFKNRDRFINLGISIMVLRKMDGMSQYELAEKANIGRSLLSQIEATGITKNFSMEVFFNIADALNISPEKLMEYSELPLYDNKTK